MENSNKRGGVSIVIAGAILLFIMSAGIYYYLGMQSGKKSLIISQRGSSSSPIFENSNPSTNLVTFRDDNLVGFSFKYNPDIWFISRNEDAKSCSDVGCSAPYGRITSLFHKQYPGYQGVALTITLVDADQLLLVDSSHLICFRDGDLVKLDSNWYRARNPYYTYNSPTTSPDRSYYLSSTLKEVGGKQCINGALNRAEQEKLPVKYNGKSTILDVSLSNSFLIQMDNIADDIVKSITFK